MSELTNIMPGILAMLAGLEVLLMVFRSTLLRAGQAVGLQRQIEELKGEFQEARERNQDREKELAAANAAAAEAQAALRRAGTELSESQQVRDVLVHRIGEPSGPVFRASVTKTLASPAEENQVLLWSCPHLVDVYTIEAEHALELGMRNFTAKAGYALGSFQPVAPKADAAEAGG